MKELYLKELGMFEPSFFRVALKLLGVALDHTLKEPAGVPALT